MEVTDFNVQTSCPKNELPQWIIGLYGGLIVPAIVYRDTSVLQRSDLIWLDKNKVKRPIVSKEAVARVFRRLADRLQGLVSDTSMKTISTDYAAHLLEVYVRRRPGLRLTKGAGIRIPGIYCKNTCFE